MCVDQCARPADPSLPPLDLFGESEEPFEGIVVSGCGATAARPGPRPYGGAVGLFSAANFVWKPPPLKSKAKQNSGLRRLNTG